MGGRVQGDRHGLHVQQRKIVCPDALWRMAHLDSVEEWNVLWITRGDVHHHHYHIHCHHYHEGYHYRHVHYRVTGRHEIEFCDQKEDFVKPTRDGGLTWDMISFI